MGDSLKPGANPGANQPDGHGLIDPANEKAMSGDKLNSKSQPRTLARVTLSAMPSEKLAEAAKLQSALRAC